MVGEEKWQIHVRALYCSLEVLNSPLNCMASIYWGKRHVNWTLKLVLPTTNGTALTSEGNQQPGMWHLWTACMSALSKIQHRIGM